MKGGEKRRGRSKQREEHIVWGQFTLFTVVFKTVFADYIIMLKSLYVASEELNLEYTVQSLHRR